MKKSTTLGIVLGISSILTSHAQVIQIADENQYSQEILNANKRVLVEFSADWCSVCNGIQKPLEEVSNEQEFKDIAFVKVDVDKLDNVSKQNGIVGVPTFVYMENGAKKVEEIGVQNMPSFRDHLRDNLRKTFHVAAHHEPASELQEQAPQHNESLARPMPVESAQPTNSAESTNIFMRIILAIQSIVMAIVGKISEFFSVIIESIKGLFN